MTYKYYTDGACTLNKTDKGYEKGPGGWAFAQIKDDKVIFAKAGYEEKDVEKGE